MHQNKKAKLVEDTARKFKGRLTMDEIFELMKVGHITTQPAEGLMWQSVIEAINLGLQ